MPPLKAQVQKDLGLFFGTPKRLAADPPDRHRPFSCGARRRNIVTASRKSSQKRENPPESIYFEGRGGTIGHLNMTSGGSEITSLLLQGGTGKEKGGRHENLTPSKN